jgi:hypothetical protein
MAETGSPVSYYFAPLGRERGGLLELLELPPTASESEIAARVGNQLQAYDDAYQTQRKLPRARLEHTQLKARLEEGEITQDDFDEETEKLVTRLLGAEITAKLQYDELQETKDSGELTQKKYEYRLMKILAPIGGKELFQQRRELSQEEFDARYEALAKRLANLDISAEEIEARRNAVVADLESAEITQEEFDELDKVWQAERTVKETRLNELRATHDAAVAKRRQRKSQGFHHDNIVWHEMVYRQGDADGDSESATERDPGWVAAAIALADDLWRELPLGHRDLWQAQIRTWQQEVGRLGPAFVVDRAFGESAEPVQGPFPGLSAPTPLYVERLEQDELEEIALRPQRGGQPQVVNMRKLLEAMLKEAATRAREEEVPATASRKPEIAKREARASAESFLEFLRALAELSEDKD